MFDYDTGSAHRSALTVLTQRVVSKVRRMLGKGDMDLAMLRMLNRQAPSELAGRACPILSFAEFPAIEGCDRYIYQDLSVCVLKELKDTNPEFLVYSGFRDVSHRAIDKREEMQRKFYTEAKGIFTMGHWLARALVEKYGVPQEKVFHVGGGCNLDPSKIDLTQKQGNKILFVGRDFERKNGPLVVEAFRHLREKRPECELYIAGPADLQLSEAGIHVLGDLKTDELATYFNLCDIFCMPSKFEAYGLVFVEAMIFGLPCIGADAYEMPYFIEDNETGYLLRGNSPEALADLMADLLTNERIKSNVRSRNEWYLKEYSWETVAQRIKNIIG